MPATVHEYKGYRIAIYSPSSHFAVITAPGSNRVLDLQDKQPRSTVVEGPLVCLDQAEALVDALIEGSDQPPTMWRHEACAETITATGSPRKCRRRIVLEPCDQIRCFLNDRTPLTAVGL